MENRVLQENASIYYDKYRDYMDFYEKKSVVAKTSGLRAEDAYALGKQLENFEDYMKFESANGSMSDLGILPTVGFFSVID